MTLHVLLQGLMLLHGVAAGGLLIQRLSEAVVGLQYPRDCLEIQPLQEHRRQRPEPLCGVARPVLDGLH